MRSIAKARKAQNAKGKMQCNTSLHGAKSRLKALAYVGSLLSVSTPALFVKRSDRLGAGVLWRNDQHDGEEVSRFSPFRVFAMDAQ